MFALMNSPWGEILSALGGGGLLKLGDMIFGRKGREVAALSATIDSLGTQLKASDSRMDEFGKRLDDCHRQHEQCEQGRREDRADISRLEQSIEKLMAEPPAKYRRSDLKRVGKT